MRDHRTARRSVRWRRLTPALAIGAIGAVALAGAARADTTPPPPQYVAAGTTTMKGGLTSDIAGSAFVGKDGRFHWTNALTAYSTNRGSAWARTFTNDDMSAVSAGMGTTTERLQAPAYYGDPGTICYQLDKHPVFPIPSPQQDDHCDVIGVWVDPQGVWHALLNDEYQFDPWQTKGANATVDEKISTGHHNNRILLATSDDEGATWQYAGPALTSAWDDDQVINSKASPGQSYPFGNSGCRLFIDYSTGYFYITYNVKIYKKPASSTLASWTEMARSPISGGMASGTWQKWHNGSWSQPGIGGIDGNVNSIGGLNVFYDPDTDLIAWQGSGTNADASYEAAKVAADHLIRFSDASGNSYTANTLAHTIVNDATGQSAPDRTVTYHDAVTGQDMTLKAVDDRYEGGVKVVTGGIYVTQTDPVTGVSQTVDLITNSAYYRDPDTGHLYLPAQNNESAISYNAFSGLYRIVGYDGNVYETADLGDPNSWKAVGLMPAGSNGGYLTSLDNGSLTNQNVTGRSFLTISDLTAKVVDIAPAPGAPGASVSTEYTPRDTAGNAVAAGSSYVLRAGQRAVVTDRGPGMDGGQGAATKATAWRLEPVADQSAKGENSGFYRLVDATTGKVLRVSGTGAAAPRAFDAVVTAGDRQADAVPLTSTSLGTPGGSDQWYLQRVAVNGTSLDGSTTYRLVNRNSGLALQYVDDRMRLEQQKPGDASQYVTLTPSAG